MKVVLGAPYKAGTDQIYDLCRTLKANTIYYPYQLNLVQWGDTDNNIIEIPKADRVIVRKGNHGISDNWNLLVEMALDDGADLVGVLNDDIQVPVASEPYRDWLTRMAEYMKQNPKCGTASGYWLYTGEGDYKKFHQDSTIWTQQHKGQVDEGLQGFLMLIRRQALFDIKEKFGHYFDPNLSCQWEDSIFTWEQYQCGWTAAILNDCPIFHWGSKTIKTQDHDWVHSEYIRGQQYFHDRTKAPANVLEWTFSMGFYCYKDEPGGPWKKWK